MARWVVGADKVVVIDDCFLRCQARQMRRMLRPDQLIETDALPLYKKYSEYFAIDDLPEADRFVADEQVAERVLQHLAPVMARKPWSIRHISPTEPRRRKEP